MSKYKYKVGDRVVCISDIVGDYTTKPTIGKVYRIRKFPYTEKNWAILDNNFRYCLDDFVPYKKVLLEELLKDE